MFESTPRTGKAGGRPPTVHEVMARVQRLSETPKPDGGYPLTSCVETYFLGDITAITAAAIRSEGLLKASAEVWRPSLAWGLCGGEFAESGRAAHSMPGLPERTGDRWYRADGGYLPVQACLHEGHVVTV